MRIPAALQTLIDEGIVERVVRPLMSGKEAQVYLVESGGEQRVAKVYKDAAHRSFTRRAEYTEGRKSRNSRDQRAMARGSRHGKAQEEAAWRSTEVDMVYRLRAAGVRVPIPHHFMEGVLVMELVKDVDGSPAPRLGEAAVDAPLARTLFDALIVEVVKMLCAGVVHGDLSDFNVLLSADGPVIIDFPQSMDAAKNQNAREILLRDVANLHRFLRSFGPTGMPMRHGAEMWALYERGELRPDSVLTGEHEPDSNDVDLKALLWELEQDERDEMRRRAALAGAPASGAGDS